LPIGFLIHSPYATLHVILSAASPRSTGERRVSTAILEILRFAQNDSA